MQPSDVRKAVVPAIERALAEAGQALSNLLSVRFRPTSSAVLLRSLSELPLLASDEDEPVVAVFFEVGQDLKGFLLVVLPAAQAQLLAEHLIGDLTAQQELRASALGEVGNIVGSAFLNHLADRFDLCATPTPPQVIEDMIGALLSSVGAYLAAGGFDEFPVVQTKLTEEHGSITAYLFWLPYDDSQRHVLEERS